jgi:hypothetical protein
MANEVIVHKGRVNYTPVNLGFDVSAETLTSEIRTHPTVDAALIVEWEISFVTDGTDGKLMLKIDDTARDIVPTKGYMDIKRVVDGEALPIFDEPLEVIFRGTVTE